MAEERRRVWVAGLAVIAVIALAFSLDGPRSSVRHGSRSETTLGTIEPGALGRVALEPKDERGTRSASRVRYWFGFLSILGGLALYLARRFASCFNRGHVPHGWDAGAVSVRGPPLQLV
jgi:hypothetical protein